jgi:hypothetical protein
MVETEGVAMEGVGDFVAVDGELGKIVGHEMKLDRINRILQD